MEKDNQNQGQQWMPGIQKAVEESFQQQSLPHGMPPLSEIKAECKKLGLTDADAEDCYDFWLMRGFKMNNGQKIHSWRHALRYRWRERLFPSQKTQAATDADLERIRAKVRRMKGAQ